jgi:hypothetical protein
MANENEQIDEQLETKYVSMADLLEEDSEFENYRPEADANAGLPPVIEGNYLAIVRYKETDPEKRWPSGKAKDEATGNMVSTGKLPVTKKEGKKYAYTEVEVELSENADASVNGRRFTAMVNTLLTRQGTTSIQALLQGCGATEDELRQANSIKGQIQLLNQYLEGGATLTGVNLRWEARYFRKDVMNEETGRLGKEIFRIRGMKKFPPNPDFDAKGGLPYLPEYPFEGEVDSTPVSESLTAFNFIHHWVPVDELAGPAGEADKPADVPAPKAETPKPPQRQPAAASAPAAGGPPVPAGAARRAVAGRR